MKLIIAGSRTTPEQNAVNYRQLLGYFSDHKHFVEDAECVISGTCKNSGDELGERWARQYDIPIVQKPADWNTHGKKAGMIRNAQMADIGDELVALWDGESRGTKNMIDEMRRRNKPYTILIFDQPVDEDKTLARFIEA